MLKPSEISSKKFEKSAFGYKVDEVDSFLKELTASYSAIIKDNEDKEAKILKLVETVTQYREDENAIQAAILGSQKQGVKIIAEAQSQADELILNAKVEYEDKTRNANNESQRILSEAIEKSNEIIKDANEKSEQIISAVKEQYLIEKSNYEKLKTEVTYFKSNLTELYNKQLRLIMDIPELDEDELNSINSKNVGDSSDKTNIEQAIIQPVDDISDENTGEQPIISNKKIEPSDENKNNSNQGFNFLSKSKNPTDFGELKFGQKK